MNTLEVTKISRANGFASVTICETDAAGRRDGFEDLTLPYDESLPETDINASLDAQLSAIAAGRGLEY